MKKSFAIAAGAVLGLAAVSTPRVAGAEELTWLQQLNKFRFYGTIVEGSFASGACRYALPVPAGQAFTLSAWGAGKFDCSVIQSIAAPTGSVTVGSNATKTVNVDAHSFRCDQLQ